MSEGRKLLLSDEAHLNFTVMLHREGLFGVKEKPEDFISLKSKRRSPHYLDIRPGISSYVTRQIVAGNMFNLARLRTKEQGYKTMQEAYVYLAGTPEAFTSYATSVADKARMGVLQPRVDTQKTSGNKTPILGKYIPNSRVGEFDDVVTDGQSKIDTIATLGAAGLIVADYFVVVDREEGGAAQVLRETGMQISPALAASRMAVMLFAEGEIGQTQFDNVAEYMDQYGDPWAQAEMAAD